MKPPAFSSRVFFLSTMAVIAVLAVLGWSLWSLAAARYKSVIDGWIEEGRKAGYEITYDDRHVFGFPRHIVMRLTNLRWRNDEGVDFRTDALDIAATPWVWTHYDAKFKGNGSLAAPVDSEGRLLLLAAKAGRVRVDVTPEGVWKEAKLALDDAKLGLAPDYIYRADALDLNLARPVVPPKDHREVGLTVEGEADDIVLPDAMPSPFGPKAAKVSVKLRVMGAMPDVRKRATVEAWNENSGIVEFDDLSIDWGDLSMTTKGTLGFDDELQPEGAYAGTISDPETVMQQLQKQGFIVERDAGMLSSAMKLFAKPATRNGKGMEFPITVQLGGLFFGPVRIFTFPEIEWPVEVPSK